MSLLAVAWFALRERKGDRAYRDKPYHGSIDKVRQPQRMKGQGERSTETALNMHLRATSMHGNMG